MTSDRFEALRRTIIDRRDEDESYLVLADYLQQLGDPRGELIALEHRAKVTGDERAKAEAREYFRANREALVGALPQLEPHLTGLRWRFGFVRQANLHFAYDEPMQVARRVVQRALDAPAMALVRRLSVVVSSATDMDPDPNNDLERAVLSALCSQERPSVRWLGLHVVGAGRVSVKLLADALPNVETLSVASQRISFGGMKSWGVRSMTLFTSAIPVASFRSVSWDVLESLSLTASIDGPLTEMLAAMPALRSFSISTLPKNVEVVGALVESGRARRLKRLRIDPLGNRELEALRLEAHRFEVLERLEVPRGEDELARHFPPHVQIVDSVGVLEADDEEAIDYAD